MQQSDKRNIACKVYKSTDSYEILKPFLAELCLGPACNTTLAVLVEVVTGLGAVL